MYIYVYITLDTLLCTSMSTDLCAILFAICMPPMRLCVYAVYKLVYVLFSKLAFQLVHKAVYVDQIVEHFVHQSPE